MTIVISNEKKFEDEFFNWLLPEIRDYVISSVDNRKLIKVDNLINSNKYFLTPFKKNISSREVIIAAVSNLKILRYWNRVVIGIDNNAIIPNTTTKISTVIRMINFGTSSILGYPVITKSFKFIEDNIDIFYEKYLQGV